MNKFRKVALLDDIPYFNSPPIQYTFEQTATVNVSGNYVWPIAKEVLTPNIIVEPDVLYFIKTITFAADVGESDYQGAISVRPTFSLYLKSNQNNPQLMSPIECPKFYDNFDYNLAIFPGSGDSSSEGWEGDSFLGTFLGSLIQTAPLVGKASIVLTMVMSVQMISDRSYLEHFKQGYLKDMDTRYKGNKPILFEGLD